MLSDRLHAAGIKPLKRLSALAAYGWIVLHLDPTHTCKLTANQLAARMRVSEDMLRRALHALEAVGAIHTRPRGRDASIVLAREQGSVLSSYIENSKA